MFEHHLLFSWLLRERLGGIRRVFLCLYFPLLKPGSIKKRRPSFESHRSWGNRFESAYFTVAASSSDTYT